MSGIVVIVRGPSGAGKSTLVKKLTEYYAGHGQETTVCSADNFFMVDTEYPDPRHSGHGPAPRAKEYRFNPTKLGEAHATCMKEFMYALDKKAPVIIVDNTHIKTWEWTNYAVAAKMAKYEVQIQEFRPERVRDIQICVDRNVHRVPADVIAKMCVEFEPCELAVVHVIWPDENKSEE